ncbi:MAG: hypothetical protein JXR97_06855, partial [Planctomycetes bacterium]|nr:hypothetical protein [Planctomycetota bacterium]
MKGNRMLTKVKSAVYGIGSKINKTGFVVGAAIATYGVGTFAMAVDADGDGVPDSSIDVAGLADSAFAVLGTTISTV